MLEKQDVSDMEHIVDTEGEDFEHRILVKNKERFYGLKSLSIDMGGEGGIEDWQQQRDGAEEGEVREAVGWRRGGGHLL